MDYFLFPFSRNPFKALPECLKPGSPCQRFARQPETMAKGIIFPAFHAGLTCLLGQEDPLRYCSSPFLSQGEAGRANCRVAATLSGRGRQLGAGRALCAEAWVSRAASVLILHPSICANVCFPSQAIGRS